MASTARGTETPAPTASESEEVHALINFYQHLQKQDGWDCEEIARDLHAKHGLGEISSQQIIHISAQLSTLALEQKLARKR